MIDTATYTGIAAVELVADHPHVAARIDAAINRSVERGDIPEHMDLSGCSACYIDNETGFSCVVFSIEGFKAYIWLWYRENPGNGDGVMERLVEHATWMAKSRGAKSVECGISPHNQRSAKLAERLGMKQSAIYWSRPI